ncbi:MAG: hypothetical protein Q8L07_01440 [Sediminibacterium sp.]|nr:hypothetical protein [Sediminibacterium sp.]
MIPEIGSKKPGFPTLLLVFAITLALGKGFRQVFIAVGLTTMWVNVARLVREQVPAFNLAGSGLRDELNVRGKL